MSTFDFEIYNVFAESAWGGNPLAIIPNADKLTSAQMQLIARQFNLSETVFICASSEHAAALRIFTPTYEMAFAGQPTLGAAAWLHKNQGLSDAFTLKLPSKNITILHDAGVYSLTAVGYTSAPCDLSHNDLAAALGLLPTDVLLDAVWMNVGTSQLLVRVNSANAIERIAPNLEKLKKCAIENDYANVYIWYEADQQVTSRYFFNTDNSIVEDPGTGSACANLGAWAHMNGFTPINWRITQAAAIGRPNHLYLNVNTAGEIQVGGRVMPFAQGQMNIPRHNIS